MNKTIRSSLRVVLLAIVLSSCHMGRKFCENNFPPTPYDSVSVVYKDSLVHDTTYVPYQELSFDTASPCPPQVVYHKEIKKGRQTLTIDIKDGKISGKCQDDSLQLIIDRMEREKITTQSKALPGKEVKIIPWWVKALLAVGALGWLCFGLCLFIYERGK